MTEVGTFGQNLAEHFGLSDAPAIVTRRLRKTAIAVTKLKCDTSNQGLTTPIPAEDAYVVALQLRDRPNYEFWLDDRPARNQPLAAGVSAFYDLRRNPITLLISPFHTLAFYLSRKALDRVADEADAKRIDDLDYEPGIGVDDPTIHNLGLSILGAFERPDQVTRLFTDYVTLTVGAHVAETYGGMKARPLPARGGLAPWQERRVKELLAANLDGDVSIMRLASACGLSSNHFSRAFRQSTGTSPHQWLLQRRVDKARQLLRDAEIPLAEAALACGFADQSHFTRVFTQSIGISPGQWRRSHHD
jgi:AraC family transcriptional regulator